MDVLHVWVSRQDERGGERRLVLVVVVVVVVFLREEEVRRGRGRRGGGGGGAIVGPKKTKKNIVPFVAVQVLPFPEPPLFFSCMKRKRSLFSSPQQAQNRLCLFANVRSRRAACAFFRKQEARRLSFRRCVSLSRAPLFQKKLHGSPQFLTTAQRAATRAALENLMVRRTQKRIRKKGAGNAANFFGTGSSRKREGASESVKGEERLFLSTSFFPPLSLSSSSATFNFLSLSLFPLLLPVIFIQINREACKAKARQATTKQESLHFLSFVVNSFFFFRSLVGQLSLSFSLFSLSFSLILSPSNKKRWGRLFKRFKQLFKKFTVGRNIVSIFLRRFFK